MLRPLPRPSRLLVATGLAMLLLPGLLGTGAGCDCREGPPPTDDTDDDTSDISIERTLQVTRVVPDVVSPGGQFSVDVLGAGFKAGAKVKAGLTDASQVNVHTATRLTVDLPALTRGEYDFTVTNPDGEAVTLRRALAVREQVVPSERCRQSTVYFEFDRDALTAEARGVIDPLISCYQDVKGVIRLEGHADERGTTDYNLALGQRRADAVHGYLVGQAVPRTVLRTVSYGEERPADPSSGERAWARNRRVEILVED